MFVQRAQGADGVVPRVLAGGVDRSPMHPWNGEDEKHRSRRDGRRGETPSPRGSRGSH